MVPLHPMSHACMNPHSTLLLQPQIHESEARLTHARETHPLATSIAALPVACACTLPAQLPTPSQPYWTAMRRGSQYTTIAASRSGNCLRNQNRCPSGTEEDTSCAFVTTMPRGVSPRVMALEARQAAKTLRSTGSSGCSASQDLRTVKAASCRLEACQGVPMITEAALNFSRGYSC